MLLTVVAFVVALGVLIAVHEYGHYRVAVACGVKVLRFSVGFGMPLLKWRSPRSGTEYVLGAFPLGGYVRMLDEREAPVEASQRHLAFNTQPLWARAAIVVAGPLANLLLAVTLYAVVNWSGVQEPRALLSSPAAESVAQKAGLRGGELVVAAAMDDEPLAPVQSFESLRWLLARAALDKRSVSVEYQPKPDVSTQRARLDFSGLDVRQMDARLFRSIGITAPWSSPVLGDLMDDGAAVASGLRSGDLVVRIDDVDVVDSQQLRELIRQSVRDTAPWTRRWTIERAGASLQLDVTPHVVKENDGLIGRIGAAVGAPYQMTTVRYGVWEGLQKSMARTWEMSELTLRLIGRVLIGEASVKNINGPLSIADYAGRSAHMGLAQYIAFLALLSVSLGVLNLLPLPVLDGGHLMYYLWEAVTGRPVSDQWTERLQRVGVAMLLLMMTVALFNDVTRLFG